jgi:hypothetical protein
LAILPDRRNGNLAVCSADPHKFARDTIAYVSGQEIAALVFEVNPSDPIDR